MGKRKTIETDESEGSSSNTESGAPESSEDDGGTYMVEVITKARVNDDRDLEYRVKWAKYPSDDDSWEPQENVQECTRLLRSFWAEVGSAYRKHPGRAGTEYVASEDWIVNERKYFWKEYKAEKEKEKRLKRAEKEREKEHKINKYKISKRTLQDDTSSISRLKKHSSLFSESDEDSDDTPLSSQLLRNKGKGRELSNISKGNPDAANTSSKAHKYLKLTIPISAASKNKFSGLKINKKPATSPAQASISGQTIAQAKEVSTSTAPASTVPPKRAFDAVIGALGAGASNNYPSNLFLPPRPRVPVSLASPVEPLRAPDEDVDNLLATIMPFEASRSQKPEIMKSLPVAEKGPTVSSSSFKFEKKWTWTGELFFDTQDVAERLCDIIINDVTDTSTIGHRLNSIVESKDSLRFSKVYRRSELNNILRSLRRVDQIARISHLTDRDKDAFAIFVKYLIKNDLVISTPVITGYGHVAEMIVFPSTNGDLHKRLNIPPRYCVPGILVLALMPCHIPPSKYSELYVRTDDIRSSAQDEELPKVRNVLVQLARPGLETPLRILDFPGWFLEFLPLRRYCIWAFPIEDRPKERGKDFSGLCLREDTKALLNLLKHLKAENAGYDGDIRVVFLHVGAVQSINRIRTLAEWRCNRPEVRFVTYGSHECVKPALWGFREIYPLGGIVTFTSSALLENPLGIADIIERIHRHPLWACYVLPSVFSVFVRLSCPGENPDPVSVYSSEPYRFGRILKLIEEGKVALMRSPGLAEQAAPGSDVDGPFHWITAQLAMLQKTSKDHLEDCWSTFVSEYANRTETEIPGLLESEIVKDLILLQTQPAIRESYRRFVVIKSMQDNHISWDNESFEWRTVQNFDFMDGYLHKPGPAESKALQ